MAMAKLAGSKRHRHNGETHQQCGVMIFVINGEKKYQNGGAKKKAARKSGGIKESEEKAASIEAA